MKRSILLIAAATLFAAGCGKKTAVVDVRSIEVDSQSDHLKVSIVRSLMSSADRQLDESCNEFNADVEGFIADLQSKVKEQADDYYARKEEDMTDYVFDFTVRDEVFRAASDYISICLNVYTFTGGAHGASDFYAFNYDVAARKFLEPGQLLDFSRSDIIDAAMQRHFDNPQGCFVEKPSLELATAVNFTGNDFVFTFAPYVLGPHSCGSARVEVPVDEIREAVIVK